MTLVSTDKAVNPTNVMGTTKRWAEMICQACESEAAALGLKTRYVCVRFGNVLGSAGSVVPLFRAQIERGGPITITHPDITRYFMTIPEACELILTACSTSAAAMERDSRVFVLDMGTPVRIIDLAERMIQLYGLTLGSDIAIKIVGLRPGEKMHEELAHAEENLVPAPFERAHLAAARTQPFSDVFAAIEQLMAMVATGDPALVRAGLRALVPEFAADQPSPSHWCPHPSVAPVNQSSQRLRAAVSAHGPL